MSIAILVLLIALIAIALVLAWLSTRSAVARLVTAILLFGFAGFCGFGFLASFELTDDAALPWQIGYGVLGVAGLAGSIALFISAIRVLWSREAEEPGHS